MDAKVGAVHNFLVDIIKFVSVRVFFNQEWLYVRRIHPNIFL